MSLNLFNNNLSSASLPFIATNSNKSSANFFQNGRSSYLDALDAAEEKLQTAQRKFSNLTMEKDSGFFFTSPLETIKKVGSFLRACLKSFQE